MVKQGSYKSSYRTDGRRIDRITGAQASVDSSHAKHSALSVGFFRGTKCVLARDESIVLYRVPLCNNNISRGDSSAFTWKNANASLNISWHIHPKPL